MTGQRPVARVAVTGVNGFVGQHLTRELVGRGIKVVGVARQRTADQAVGDLVDDYVSTDLTTGWPELGPLDGIVHLASLAAIGPSFDDPQRYIEVNSSMVTHLGESLVRAGSAARLLVVSSGSVYGASSVPLTELSAPVMTSPYAVSKVLVENQVEYYAARGLDTVVVRPFNHIGPGQAAGFLVPDLVGKLRAIADGEDVTFGNLDTVRDYTDVRDVVRAYADLLSADSLQHRVYNVASGVGVSGWSVLAELSAATGLPSVERTAPIDKTRAVDPSIVTADSSRLRNETGWAPSIALRQSLEDYVAAS